MKNVVRNPVVKPCVHERYKYVVTSYHGGKRVRSYFFTRRDAEDAVRAEIAERDAMPVADGPLMAGERAGVLEARRLRVPLLEAVHAYYDRAVALGRSATLGALVADRLRTVEVQKASGIYRKNLECFLDRLVEAIGKETNVGFVTVEQCRAFLFGQGWGDVSIRYYRGLLVGLFNHGVKHGLCTVNPALLVPVPKLPAADAVSVLRPDQCLELLLACDRSILPGVAIALFAGLRPDSEVQRLDWAQVNLKQGFIEVLAKNSKSASRRLVKVSAALRAWLSWWSGDEDLPESGPVWPTKTTGRRRWRDARAALGWGSGEGQTAWPQDVLRHSFASYHLARGRNAAKTALELGHTTTAKLFSNYRGVVTKADATAFWALRP